MAHQGCGVLVVGIAWLAVAHSWEAHAEVEPGILPATVQGLIGPPHSETSAIQPEARNDRVLVRFKSGTNRASQEFAHAKSNAIRVRREFKSVRELQVVETLPGSVEEVLRAYQADPAVLYAEPDYFVSAQNLPNDEQFGQLWGMRNTGQTADGIFCYATGLKGADIGVERAWDFWTGDPEFRVAIIDTGVNYLHPDLAANIWSNPREAIGDQNQDRCPGLCGVDDDGDGRIDEDSRDRVPADTDYANDRDDDDDENGWNDDIHGYDWFNGDGDPLDDNSHGSHCAGTIGAVGNNGIGVAGVNWGCKFVALKILGRTGSGGSISDIVEAIDYIIVNRIRVSNNSWGFSSGFSQSLYDAIEASQSVGHLFIAAAGNDFGRSNDHLLQFPAAFDLPNIIAVAATENRFGIAPFSSLGQTTVDLAAPGVCILSTVLGEDYGYKDGTSMATPHVTGVVALVMSRYPNLHWRQVRERVLYSSRPNPAFAGVTLFGSVLSAADALGDCNHNGVWDEQDIRDGTSQDCSGNGLPDECEPDCNGNRRADSCDLSMKSSPDCNDNARPDECDMDCNGNKVIDACEIAAGMGRNCNQNYVPDECEIEAGSPAPGGPYFCHNLCTPDCNDNGIPDRCDLAAGTSEDCGRNRIPDECEPDCNGNDVPDECDINLSTSRDCSGNRIPDECEPDCNLNGHADSCDIHLGRSTDCDGNAIPDDCEQKHNADCNANMVSDSCELSRELALDCNSNRVLDECDIRDGTSIDLDATLIPDECDDEGFSLVPISASGAYTIQGREIEFLGGGRTLTFEVRFHGWDLTPDGDPPLRAYEVRIDSRGFSSGQYGSMHYAFIPCETNDDCFGRSNCQPNEYCDLFATAFIDPFRPDFVFQDRLNVQFTNPVQHAPDITLLAALWNQTDSVPDLHPEYYAGTLKLDVSPVAAGTFTIGFVRRGTQLRRAGSEPITVPNLLPAIVIIRPDCNLNGVDDRVEIAAQESLDCNANGILDQCISLETDCNANRVPDTCDIAHGSVDCNLNGIPDECRSLENDCNENAFPDECDIQFGISTDCNANGTPDECLRSEGDCNQNHLPDDCDIAIGFSADCNRNGVPDECLNVEGDCDHNLLPDACDLADGAPDCNLNHSPDSCDVTDGNSRDCNHNGVPDECRPAEADCNLNDQPDDCDLADELSGDCNRNTIPDECDIASGLATDLNADGIPDSCSRLLRVPGEFPNIQAALDEALSGDVVLVADGVYSGPGNTELNLSGKFIAVRSEGGASRCTIDGRKSSRAFFFGGHEDERTVIEGFTLTGGYANRGGAIYCRRGSPIISRCLLTGNTAQSLGGAVYCELQGNPTFRHCTLAGNVAGHNGGAAYAENQSNPRFHNCLVVRNIAQSAGGAFYCDNLSSPTINHCTVVGNQATFGGALYGARRLLKAPGFVAPNVLNSLLAVNRATGGGREIFLAASAQLSIEYSAVLGGPSSTLLQSNAELRWGADNVFDNPLLEDSDGSDNDPATWEDNNYRLDRISPCINGGAPDPLRDMTEVDLDGIARVLCGRVDIGAYEFGIGDGNCSHRVNTTDLQVWPACATGPVGNVYAEGCESFDFEFDGDVDLVDLAALQRMMEP